MNKVTLVGRLTKDVELRNNGDNAFARFTLAINHPFKNKESGEYDADFISCKAFGKTAEFISEWFSKGDPIGISGRIQTGSYENKNGDTVYTTDVMVESAEFVCGKKEREDGSGSHKKSERPKERDYDNDEEYENPKGKRKSTPENTVDYEETEDNDYPF